MAIVRDHRDAAEAQRAALAAQLRGMSPFDPRRMAVQQQLRALESRPPTAQEQTNLQARTAAGGGMGDSRDRYGFDARSAQIQADRNRYGNTTAPGLNRTQINDASGQLLGQLQQSASGQGPSVAEEQLKAAMQRNISGQQALLASGNPSQAAGNARMAMQQSGLAAGSLAGQGAMARAAEAMNAQQQLGNFLGQNQGAILNQTGMNNQYRLGLGGLDLQNAGLNQSGDLQRRQLAEQIRQFNASQPSTFDTIMGGLGSVGETMLPYIVKKK